MTAFRRAQRQRVYIKLAITGPSGSGKTYSALRLAFGLGARVAMLDTENGSGSLYADLGDYDLLDIEAPFTVSKYIEGICAAEEARYDVLLIDSLSHAWAGDGGLLAKKETLDSRGGNPFSNWAAISKDHEALKSAILQSDIHIIATMRSKTDYVMIEDRTGKATPRKVGLAPVQRDGIEYEFSTVFDLTMDHAACASKDRTGLFDGQTDILTEKHGRRLLEWLSTGADPAPRRAAPPLYQAYHASVATQRADGRASTGQPAAWLGPGLCPGCHAPEGKRHATGCGFMKDEG